MADRPLYAIAGWGLRAAPPVPTRILAAAELLPEVGRHKLIGVLEAMLREGQARVDDEEAVATAHADAMAEALLLEDVLLQAIDVLDSVGVEWRVLKGSALAHTVPVSPSMRSFGDNDLLIRGEQMQAAVDAITEAGGHRLQRRVSPLFDRRFTKSVTMGWRAATELDLHRTLAPGPFGLRSSPAGLFGDSAFFELAGRRVATLSPELHLMHAAVHVALGGFDPRLGNVRDIALLLEHPGIDPEAVREDARRWGYEYPLTLGLQAAVEIGATRHPVVEWARAFVPSDKDARLLGSYHHTVKRFRAQAWASLRVLGWRDRAAYVWALGRRH